MERCGPPPGPNCRHLPATGELEWNTPSYYWRDLFLFSDSWAKQQALTTEEQELVSSGFSYSGKAYKAVQIGPVSVPIGGWFLARPSMLELVGDAGRMWFGHVEVILPSAHGPHGQGEPGPAGGSRALPVACPKNQPPTRPLNPNLKRHL